MWSRLVIDERRLRSARQPARSRRTPNMESAEEARAGIACIQVGTYEAARRSTSTRCQAPYRDVAEDWERPDEATSPHQRCRLALLGRRSAEASLRTEQFRSDLIPRTRRRGICVVRVQASIELFAHGIADRHGFRNIEEAIPNGLDDLETFIGRQLEEPSKVFHGRDCNKRREHPRG